MPAGPTASDLLAALAAAVVEADAGDPRSLREVGEALDRARKAGALPGPLAAEADGLARAMRRKGEMAGALSRISALLADEGPRAPSAPAAATPAAGAQRDAETIELIGDFLEESGEGLARADETLLAVERDGPEADKVHALFRVFHTIKGVAGFLELTEIVSLSHSTENLLNLVRDGKLELARRGVRGRLRGHRRAAPAPAPAPRRRRRGPGAPVGPGRRAAGGPHLGRGEPRGAGGPRAAPGRPAALGAARARAGSRPAVGPGASPLGAARASGVGRGAGRRPRVRGAPGTGGHARVRRPPRARPAGRGRGRRPARHPAPRDRQGRSGARRLDGRDDRRAHHRRVDGGPRPRDAAPGLAQAAQLPQPAHQDQPRSPERGHAHAHGPGPERLPEDGAHWCAISRARPARTSCWSCRARTPRWTGAWWSGSRIRSCTWSATPSTTAWRAPPSARGRASRRARRCGSRPTTRAARSWSSSSTTAAG